MFDWFGYCKLSDNSAEIAKFSELNHQKNIQLNRELNLAKPKSKRTKEPLS